MNTRSSKRELLEAYLGNFDEYIFTGWMIDNAASDLTDPANWECHWKTPLYPLTDFKLEQFPEILGACHCTTPIIWNCLIKHKPTGRLEFVGSVCMHYFDMNLKRCIQCNNPNRSSYRRCKTCRTLCKLHGECHDDNATHTRPPPQPRVVPPQSRRRAPMQHHLLEGYIASPPDPKTPRTVVSPQPVARTFDDRPLTFGKYKGRCPKHLVYDGPDGVGYYFWLFGCNLLTEADKIDLGISMRYMRPLKGKYSGTLTNFQDIEKNDPGYYSWMKRTWSDAFVKYLP